MTPISWTPQAQVDLDEMMDVIAEDNPRAAARVVRDIIEAVEHLRVFPMLGRAWRVAGTRELVVSRTPYVVAYRFAAEVVTVLNIFHGAQLWPEEF